MAAGACARSFGFLMGYRQLNCVQCSNHFSPNHANTKTVVHYAVLCRITAAAVHRGLSVIPVQWLTYRTTCVWRRKVKFQRTLNSEMWYPQSDWPTDGMTWHDPAPAVCIESTHLPQTTLFDQFYPRPILMTALFFEYTSKLQWSSFLQNAYLHHSE